MTGLILNVCYISMFFNIVSPLSYLIDYIRRLKDRQTIDKKYWDVQPNPYPQFAHKPKYGNVWQNILA